MLSLPAGQVGLLPWPGLQNIDTWQTKSISILLGTGCEFFPVLIGGKFKFQKSPVFDRNRLQWVVFYRRLERPVYRFDKIHLTISELKMLFHAAFQFHKLTQK
jgi:hypothetical protein